MADDRIGDHCWGKIPIRSGTAREWVKGHLRQWLANQGDVPTGIFEDKETGNVHEITLAELNFESDMPK